MCDVCLFRGFVCDQHPLLLTGGSACRFPALGGTALAVMGDADPLGRILCSFGGSSAGGAGSAGVRTLVMIVIDNQSLLSVSGRMPRVW